MNFRLFAVVFVLLSLTGKSQSYLGIKLLPETNFISEDKAEETFNLSGGIILMKNFDKVDIESGILFYQTGAKYSRILNDQSGNFVDRADFDIRYQYFTVPLNLHYHLGKVYLTAGIGANYLVNGEVQEKNDRYDLHVIFKNFALQGKAGIGYLAPLSEKSSIAVEFNVKPFLTTVDVNFIGNPVCLGLGIILMRQI